MLIALLAAVLVFGVWYPSPYDELVGGRGLFTLIVIVDLVCGPILTLVLFDPAKSKRKWYFDLSLIVVMQLAALLYGLAQVAAARPVFLAFEGNRFRVVQAIDVDANDLAQAPTHLQSLSYQGPRLIGARLSKSTDADFLTSLNQSMQGRHPSFRPSRWTDYSEQSQALREQLEPLKKLREKNPSKTDTLNAAISATGLPENRLGYVPLVREPITDWVVIVDRQTAMPVAYLHMDGW
ncbi:hypothetical protein KIH26_00430 [Variovorax sp. PCZ-1]|nr:hypothetical protein [Variovorax sp. PCZ-1]